MGALCAGTYLPLTAVLGGSLFLKPDGFQEAARDVVRLSPRIPDMLAQQARWARWARSLCAWQLPFAHNFLSPASLLAGVQCGVVLCSAAAAE